MAAPKVLLGAEVAAAESVFAVVSSPNGRALLPGRTLWWIGSSFLPD